MWVWQYIPWTLQFTSVLEGWIKACNDPYCIFIVQLNHINNKSRIKPGTVDL